MQNYKDIMDQINEILPPSDIDKLRIKIAKEKDEKIKKEIISGIMEQLKPLIDQLKIPPEKYIQSNDRFQIQIPPIDVRIPEIKIPDIQLPEIKIPEIAVPKAEVEVKIPEIKVPTPKVTVNPPEVKVNVPQMKFPKEMEVKGIAGFFKSVLDAIKGTFNVSLADVSQDNPIPVILTDEEGNFYRNLGGGVSVVGGGTGSSSGILSEIKDAVSAGGETGTGTQSVTAAGTAEQLPSIECKRVYITAHESNTGTIVIGDENVIAALAGRRGKALYPTQGDWFQVNNLNKLWVDATVNADAIHFYYEK